MCIILIGKIGKNLHKQAKAQNPDGFSLFTQKQGLVKAPTEKQVDDAVKEFGIWHYRIASSGKVDEHNIHPFPVAHGKWYLYHNGIIGSGTATKSDTNCLAETLYNSPIRTIDKVLESLSSSNRFCLVNAKDPHEFYLYGNWACEAGVLMSHKMYSATVYAKQTTAQKAGWALGTYYGKGIGSYKGEDDDYDV